MGNLSKREPTDEAVRHFVLEATIQRVAYVKFIKTTGYAVDIDQIARLEEEIRVETAKLGDVGSGLIDKRCVSELQLELAFAELDFDLDDNIDDEERADALKALLYRDGQLTVKMYQEQRHQRPHFHVEFGRYSASYAVDNFDLLAGEMPSKYERVILKWARRYR